MERYLAVVSLKNVQVYQSDTGEVETSRALSTIDPATYSTTTTVAT